MNTGEATTPAPPPKPRPFQFSLRKFLGMLVIVAIVLSIFATLRPRPRRPDEHDMRSACRNNLAQLGLGLSDYFVRHGTLPPAYIPDRQGNPAHSWRVLILPQLEEPALYETYNFKEAWDGPNNRRLLDAQCSCCFACPSDPNARKEFRTSYVAVIGEDTLWPGPLGRRSNELPSNAKDKILLIEIPDSDIKWMEPRDISLEEAIDLFRDFKEGVLETQHGNELHYVTFGWYRSRLSLIESVEQFREMLTIEPLPKKPGQAGRTPKAEGASTD